VGFLDRLFGTAADPDEEATVERYRRIIRTAPPATIEQVHAEAFSRLSDPQRALIYEELSKGAGTGERPLSSEPATLARAAIRAEMRVPGSMERVVTDGGQLDRVADHVIGSALVSAFLPSAARARATDAAAS
jgi:hypothetical protein